MISTTSPVTRVISSTREAVLTTSPMTVNSTCPPPPIVPATTAPELTPIPISQAPAVLLAHRLGHLERGRDAAVGVVGQRVRRAEHGQQAVADELVGVGAVLGQHRHDELVERVELGHDLGRRGLLGERGEAADVEEQDRDLDLLALELGPLLDHALGEHRVDERAERLAQALALGQPGDHLVERAGQRAGLVGAEHRDPDAEVAVGDARQPLAQLGDRLEDRARQQHRHLERDRERDDERDQHADAERLDARVRLRQAADHDAGDDADRRQRDRASGSASAP